MEMLGSATILQSEENFYFKTKELGPMGGSG